MNGSSPNALMVICKPLLSLVIVFSEKRENSSLGYDCSKLNVLIVDEYAGFGLHELLLVGSQAV